MTELISIENLIEQVKAKGINFGKGDPYNRLRYYTKMGWLPHMIRKKHADSGSITGHYPKEALNLIVTIEKLKEKGLDNEQIAKKLESKNKVTSFKNILISPEIKNKLVGYATLALLIVIFANELGLITLGRSKQELFIPTIEGMPKQILESGSGTLFKNQKKVFIKSSLITGTSKVYVTFTQNFSPATRYWVTELKPSEGFFVEVDVPLLENANFSWWISN